MFNKIRTSYLAFITIWYLLWLGQIHLGWWMIGINWYAPYLFWPVPFLVVDSFWHKRGRWFALIPVLVFVFAFGSFLLPRWGGGKSADFRTMTYNVLCSNTDWDAMTAMINTYEADLIALQEVGPHIYPELASRLEATYPYNLFDEPTKENPCTTAVFSRTPILQSKIIELGVLRPAVQIETEIKGHPVTFISAHLYPSYWALRSGWRVIPRELKSYRQAQLQEVAQLTAEAETQSGIVILGCDCNSRFSAAAYRHLRHDWQDSAHASRGFRVSPPDRAQVDRDFGRIDYLFWRGPLDAAGTYAIDDWAGSDHPPIIADFGFAD